MEEVKVPKYHLIENDILDKINSGIYEAVNRPKLIQRNPIIKSFS